MSRLCAVLCSVPPRPGVACDLRVWHLSSSRPRLLCEQLAGRAQAFCFGDRPGMSGSIVWRGCGFPASVNRWYRLYVENRERNSLKKNKMSTANFYSGSVRDSNCRQSCVSLWFNWFVGFRLSIPSPQPCLFPENEHTMPKSDDREVSGLAPGMASLCHSTF